MLQNGHEGESRSDINDDESVLRVLCSLMKEYMENAYTVSIQGLVPGGDFANGVDT
ncbi:uncharacterized protein G2W53_010964 [Senna tora]|uniref:Uncharacterized protein n=1 Tax=Senna tora TaxID=362788 RepID=A0A834X0A1_9FABA|nr:uncharacterized protein G2W53_010964 [Senna tora]